MKKFGFGKKDKSAEGDDANRNALFGNKKASAGDNPYAQSQSANDPYMNDTNKYMSPYQQARTNLGPSPQGPVPGQYGRPGPGGPGLNRQDSGSSTATAPPPYGAAPTGGYGNDRVGAQSGYGSNRYAAGGGGGYGGAPARQGGYGGLGPSDGDDNRDALFSGAQQRQQQRQTTNNNAYSQNQGSGAGGSGKYAGGYGEQRQLTEEEQEEADVEDTKAQIHDIRQQSKQTVFNSEAITNQILDNASATYARLGAQHERLNYTEQRLDAGAIHAHQAEDQNRQLKHELRSMWNPGMKNPFASGKRNAELERKLLEQHREDRATREATRKDGYNANQNMELGFKSLSGANPNGGYQKSSAAERSKYTFEEGDSDEEEIDQGLDRLAQNVSKINMAARLIGDEIESQNAVIDRLGTKSDALSDRTLLNTARLQKISRNA